MSKGRPGVAYKHQAQAGSSRSLTKTSHCFVPSCLHIIKTHHASLFCCCCFIYSPQQGNIFIVDYELLDGVDANKTDPCTIQYLAAPICLLYKNLEKKIVPIAIQVGLLSGYLEGHAVCCLILIMKGLGFHILFISCSLVKSLDQTIPSSFLQMPHTTGCWLKFGSARLISTSTRQWPTSCGHTWSQRCSA